jgi:spore maturation protein CgeB
MGDLDLKILIVAWVNPTDTDMPLFYMRHWRAMGHEVEMVPYDQTVTDEPWCRFLNSVEGCQLELGERRIAAMCHRYQPDVLFLFYHFMRAQKMERLRRKCGCKVGFYLDNNNLLWQDTAQCMSVADFVVVHDRYVVPLVQGTQAGRNPNVFYVRGAAEPSVHRPLKLDDWDLNRYGCDIAFIGGSGPDRLNALQMLTRHRLKIWGERQDWQRFPELSSFVSDEPVYGHKKTKIYNASAIVLNLEEGEKQINAINPRICEVLACHGFVLTNHTNDLEQAGFRDGESVVWFKSNEEMIEKVDFYLSRPEERARISQKGHQLVLENLTYEKLARDWMDWMALVCMSKQ